MRQALGQELREKIDALGKPKGSLGALEDMAVQIGLVQGTTKPELRHPCHLLFASDHGIEREGVSASPREVTWQQVANFSRGGGAVNVLCRQHGIELTLVDVGVDHDMAAFPTVLNRKASAHGTRNFLHEAAMSPEEAEHCLLTGQEMAEACAGRGCNVLSLGEMGIGNTSPSSLWMHLLTGIDLDLCVGRGSGLDERGTAHKLSVLSRCVERARPTEPMEVMREFGGYEMASAVGAMLRAKELGMTVLVDGFIMTACALMALRLDAGFASCAIYCHEGSEAGHSLLLRHIGAKGVLGLGLRLGEGTGALLAYPIVESSLRLLNEMNSFENAGVTKYF